jgi:hypothetical protein
MGDAPLKVTAKQLDDGGIEDTTADKEPTTGLLHVPGGYDPCSALRRPTAARARTPVDLFGHLPC